MAEEFEFLFSVPQIEALIRALENCGVNTGSYQSMLESFRDTQLANAAKAAHGVLRRKGQKQSRPDQKTIAHELTKDSVASDLREALRKQREDYDQLLKQSEHLLAAVVVLRSALSRRLNVRPDADEQAAIERLDNVLAGISLESESDLARKLYAIQGS